MKRLLIIIALFLGIPASQAQIRAIWQKANHFLTQPELVDTTRIYQPSKACFSVGLSSSGQKAGFDVDVNFGINLGEAGSLNGISSYRFSEHLCKKIGIEAGYGDAGFGYSFEVGSQSAWKKNTLGFNIFGRIWGVRMNYFKITNPFISSLAIGQEGDEDYFYDEIPTEDPAILRSLTIDGYYVVNNKRFAYPAAYKMGMVQRRTTDSWILTARYCKATRTTRLKPHGIPTICWTAFPPCKPQ